MKTVLLNRRLAAYRALCAYAWALGSTFLCSTGLVWIVGSWRAAGRPNLVDAEAMSFAHSASGVIAGAGVEALVVALVAFLSAAQISTIEYSTIDRLRLQRGRATPLGTGAAVFALLGLSAGAGSVIQLLHVPGSASLETVLGALHGSDFTTLLIALGAVGLAPAFAEEVFFRGFLQSQLAPSWRKVPTVVATSMAFGIFHLNFAQGAAAFASGLLLGWTADRFESVRPCITAHAINNMLFAAVATMSPRWATSVQVQPWILGCGSVVFAVSAAVLTSPAAVCTRREGPPSIIREPARP